MDRIRINEFQNAIEDKVGNLIFRFTETIEDSNGRKTYNVKLNEISDVSSGVARFVWSDETSLSLSKSYASEFDMESFNEFARELVVAFNLHDFVFC